MLVSGSKISRSCRNFCKPALWRHSRMSDTVATISRRRDVRVHARHACTSRMHTQIPTLLPIKKRKRESIEPLINRVSLFVSIRRDPFPHKNQSCSEYPIDKKQNTSCIYVLCNYQLTSFIPQTRFRLMSEIHFV